MRTRSTILGFAFLTLLLTAGAAQSLSGSNTVFTDDIAPGAVNFSDIHENAVTSSRIANGSVFSGDVADNSLTGTDISGSAPGLKKMFVTRVKSNGAKISGDATSSAREESLIPNGFYQLQFPFPVGSCAALVSPGDKKVGTGTDGNHDALGQALAVRLASGGPNGVQVVSLGQDGAPKDSAFTLVLLCP